MKKFKGLEVWRWYSCMASKRFGYSLSFCDFFCMWEYTLFNYSISKSIFAFSYSPCETHGHPHRDYYYKGKRLFIQIFALTLVNTVLYKTDVKFDYEDIY